MNATQTQERPTTERKGIISKTVDRVVSAVTTVTASVKFDTNRGEWAILDTSGNAKEFFTHGVMWDVEFSVKTKRDGGGCGGATETYEGIATGKLRKNYDGKDMIGYENLAFKGGSFIDVTGQKINSARSLRLLHDRRALYK